MIRKEFPGVYECQGALFIFYGKLGIYFWIFMEYNYTYK